MEKGVFDTNRRIRLGVWGLGRGASFFEACAACHLDVVAGCDYNAHMREAFKRQVPDALVTDDAETFLNSDIDAVLLATFCPNHADDAIRCLDAGKHVLSEVTAFHTAAEGVKLVEAVERSGKVYNLAENYPFTAPQMYIARRWKEGLFGELMYAEGEYVHEVRSLAYTYIDGVPVEPGWALHHWRSWLHSHFYCTHSLGPIMHITGQRPERVTALPGNKTLAGYPPSKSGGLSSVAPSLIQMDNGGLVKNLMGGTTNDSHIFRYWGTLGAAEINNGLFLRLGGGGSTPKLPVKADWGELTHLADKMGHGGGDFFVLYYFARHILFDKPAFFDIYTAADVTLPGILAYRSCCENGAPYDVPDFRQQADRDAWRDDHVAPERPDVAQGSFPKEADREVVAPFNRVIRDLINNALAYRAYVDWRQVLDDMENPAEILSTLDRAIECAPALRETIFEAQAIIDAYPQSEGARALREMMEIAQADSVLAEGFISSLTDERTRLQRRFLTK